MPSSSPSASVTTSIEEQVQLQRIFRLLAFDIPLQRINQKLEKLEDRRPEASTRTPKASISHSSLADTTAKRACYLQQRDKFTSTLQDEVGYGRELVSTRFQVGAKALQAVYERLGCPITTVGKGFADDLIWQVNDALDGAVSFDEFERSYLRARGDRTGMEPAELFYLTCFLMFDRECTGKILLDDAMSILYLKYGDAMEQEMALRFSALIDSGAHTVTFAQYREATTRRVGELIDQAIGARTAKPTKKSSP